MAWAVFLRGVNVGQRRLRPQALADDLGVLHLHSLGAAGTFAAHTDRSAEDLRAAIAAALPFSTEIIVVPADAIRRLLRHPPGAPGPLPAGQRRYLTIATTPIPQGDRLPLHFPDPERWQVRLEAIDGPFASGTRRRRPGPMVYPNAAIERHFGVRATTRWWETVQALQAALASPRAAAAAGSARRGHETPKSAVR